MLSFCPCCHDCTGPCTSNFCLCCSYDAFALEDYGPQPSQRVATVLVYLTDVKEGGTLSKALSCCLRQQAAAVTSGDLCMQSVLITLNSLCQLQGRLSFRLKGSKAWQGLQALTIGSVQMA